MSLDFLAIGDITTDAFIRLSNATVNCDVDKENCKLCMNFGDKLPYEFVKEAIAVGNSPNAAVSAARLGLNSGVMTNIGDDRNGGECLATLKKNGVNIDYVTTHKNMETNYHYVLWYEDERTILVKHQEYPYELPEMDPPKWIYLSSLAENSLPFHDEIVEYVKNNPDVNLAFQPGTFQMKMGTEKLGHVYEVSKLFFCNVEESKRILYHKGEDIDVKDLLKEMREKGPEIVVITDGKKGAYAYDGSEMWFMPPYPDPKPPYDRTGAGDSFSSTFTSALALGKSLPEALQWGPINSMSVVQYIGAQDGLLPREKLEEHLANRPEDYEPQKLE